MQQFEIAMGYSDNALIHRLFHLLDVNESGYVDFREYIFGVSVKQYSWEFLSWTKVWGGIVIDKKLENNVPYKKLKNIVPYTQSFVPQKVGEYRPA